MSSQVICLLLEKAGILFPCMAHPSRLFLCNLLTPGVEKRTVGLSGTFAFKLFQFYLTNNLTLHFFEHLFFSGDTRSCRCHISEGWEGPSWGVVTDKTFVWMLEVTLHRRPPHCCYFLFSFFLLYQGRSWESGEIWASVVALASGMESFALLNHCYCSPLGGPAKPRGPALVVSLPAFWGDSAALESWNEQEKNLTLFYIYLFKIEKCSGTSVRFHSNLGLIKKKVSFSFSCSKYSDIFYSVCFLRSWDDCFPVKSLVY